MLRLAASIIIATYNRSEDLKEILLSFFNNSREDIEIIVVDNNSTDDTANVVKEFLNKDERFRYVVEKKQGLSHARNCGIEESNASIIAFIDDDALPSAQWIDEIISFFSKSRDRYAIVGGPIIPKWKSDPPSWLSDYLRSYLSLLDIDEHDRELDKYEYVYGTNFAFRKELLAANVCFNQELGRIKNKLISNEEILFQIQARQKGYRIFYLKAMTVYHKIEAERLNLFWFIKRAYWQGHSDSVVSNELKSEISFFFRSKETSFLKRLKNKSFFTLIVITVNRIGRLIGRYHIICQYR